MKTYEEMKLDTLTEEEILTELSLGKVSSTVLVSRIVQLTRKMKDKELGNVIKWVSFLIYSVSLQFKSKKKEEYKRKRIKTW